MLNTKTRMPTSFIAFGTALRSPCSPYSFTVCL
jgi:hypothetical protein